MTALGALFVCDHHVTVCCRNWRTVLLSHVNALYLRRMTAVVYAFSSHNGRSPARDVSKHGHHRIQTDCHTRELVTVGRQKCTRPFNSEFLKKPIIFYARNFYQDLMWGSIGIHCLCILQYGQPMPYNVLLHRLLNQCRLLNQLVTSPPKPTCVVGPPCNAPKALPDRRQKTNGTNNVMNYDTCPCLPS